MQLTTTVSKLRTMLDINLPEIDKNERINLLVVLENFGVLETMRVMRFADHGINAKICAKTAAVKFAQDALWLYEERNEGDTRLSDALNITLNFITHQKDIERIEKLFNFVSQLADSLDEQVSKFVARSTACAIMAVLAKETTATAINACSTAYAAQCAYNAAYKNSSSLCTKNQVKIVKELLA